MAINGLFVRTDPQRRRYGVALPVGVLSGIISAFVKWGAGVPCHRAHFPVVAMNLTRRISFYEII